MADGRRTKAARSWQHTLGLGNRTSGALSLARTELVFAALRVVCGALTIATIAVPSGVAAEQARPQGIGAASAGLSLVVLALLVLVARTKTAEGLRRVGVICTVADIAVYAAWTIAFHSYAGGSIGLLGVLVFIEGPVRWGLIGGGLAVSAIMAVALIWPQVDTAGATPPAGQTWMVGSLLFLITVGVTAFLRRTAAVVRQAHEQFLRVFESSSTGMALISPKGAVLESNRALAASFALSIDQMAGVDLSSLAAEASREALQGAIARVVQGGHGERLELQFHTLGSHTFDAVIELTRIDGGVGVPPMVAVQVDDVSERKAFEERLSYQASHDVLTGLPNRAFLRSRLEEALSPRPGWAPCAVLFCDLDRFKRVNDSLGHDLGDALLIETAARLERVVRPGDVVGRLGGDEFVILMHSVWTEADVMPLADRVLDVLRAPTRVAGHELHSGGSVGIALARPGDTPEVLLRDADTAMYRAKEAGGGCAVMFSPSMRTELLEQQELETALRQALTDDRLSLAYQVGVELDSGRVSLVEALLRWPQRHWSTYSPNELVRVAEESGFAGQLGAWVVRRAVQDAMTWGEYDGLVSVNASSRQVADPAFCLSLSALLELTGFPAERLCIEVTEETLTDDAEVVATALHSLQRMGVKVAIDDFGTGHASLSRLARMPVDVLKIDREFTRGVTEESGHRAIIEGIVGMARAFDLVVVAEGVETADQLGALQEVGAHMAQGFLLAEPTDAVSVSVRLAAPRIVAPRQSPEDAALVVPEHSSR